MAAPSAPDVTGRLLAWREGDDAALERLIPLVYRELRALAHARMRREHPGLPLQTIALVHEAYVRLVARLDSHGLAALRNREVADAG